MDIAKFARSKWVFFNHARRMASERRKNSIKKLLGHISISLQKVSHFVDNFAGRAGAAAAALERRNIWLG